MKGARLFIVCFCLGVGYAGAARAISPIIEYSDVGAVNESVLIDARASSKCERESLPKARCLPASDFLTPQGKLANFSGILWLLGTVGLTGEEHVTVFADRLEDAEFVAGILYLAGQRKISILTKWRQTKTGKGVPRSKTREKVFRAMMRDKAIILPGELANSLNRKEATIAVGRSAKQAVIDFARLASRSIDAKVLIGKWKKPDGSWLAGSNDKLILFAIFVFCLVVALTYFFIRLSKVGGEK